MTAERCAVSSSVGRTLHDPKQTQASWNHSKSSTLVATITLGLNWFTIQPAIRVITVYVPLWSAAQQSETEASLAQYTVNPSLNFTTLLCVKVTSSSLSSSCKCVKVLLHQSSAAPNDNQKQPVGCDAHTAAQQNKKDDL